METLFVIAAVIGGTLMLAQLLMSLLGLGGHGDLAGSGHDFAGHFSGDHGGDFGGAHDGLGGHSAGSPHDSGAFHQAGTGHAASVHGGQHAGTGHAGSSGHAAPLSNWYFGLITFQTLVAALTFFGLAGMTAHSAQMSSPLPLVVAVAGGVAAMFGVHGMMRTLQRLRSDGTERIEGAVGREGTVYLSIPGHNQGCGKVSLVLQNRMVEYDAMTSGEALPTGAPVIVVGLLGLGTLEVAPAGAEGRRDRFSGSTAA